MEIKKSRKADLENRRGLFLEIGLILALVVVVIAFSCTTKDRGIEQIDLQQGPVETELIEVTREDQKPPEAPPKKVEVNMTNDAFQMIKNDSKIDTKMTFDEFDDDVAITVAPPPKEKIEDEIFIVVDDPAKFMGGDLDTFRNWVQNRMKYPPLAAEINLQGRVILEFVIEKDGRLTNIKVLRTPDSSLSEEAVRVLNTSPKWTPPKQRGRPVRQRFTFWVEFKLSE